MKGGYFTCLNSTKQKKTKKQTDNLNQETMSFNDTCATPVICQVESPAYLKNGIVELPDKGQSADTVILSTLVGCPVVP